MDGLGFWDMFWPVFTALIFAGLCFEGLNFGLAYYQAKKQLREYNEIQEKIAKGEVTPEMLGYMANSLGGIPAGFEGLPTTVSGNETISHGQYL